MSAQKEYTISLFNSVAKFFKVFVADIPFDFVLVKLWKVKKFNKINRKIDVRFLDDF